MTPPRQVLKSIVLQNGAVQGVEFQVVLATDLPHLDSLSLGRSAAGVLSIFDASSGVFGTLTYDSAFFALLDNLGASAALSVGELDTTHLQVSGPAFVTMQTATDLMRVKANVGQSVDIFEVTNQSNTPYMRVNKSGYLIVHKTSAPPDADLIAGDVSIWLDATPGAAVFNIKAKDSGGTVRTGSINLT